MEGGRDEIDAVLIDVADEAGESAMVGQNGSDQSKGVSRRDGPTGGVEQRLPEDRVAHPSLCFSEPDAEIDGQLRIVVTQEGEAVPVPVSGLRVGQHGQRLVAGRQAGGGGTPG